MKDGQSYPKIEELALKLSNRLQKMTEGKLKMDELDELVDMAREVYERSVVIRYKAIDAPSAEPPKPAPAPNIKFKIDKGVVSQNQTSLIDAIEEIHSEIKSGAVEEVAEPIESKTATTQPEVHVNMDTDEPVSVAEKLHLAPIESIKAEIGLNQKFRFINDLFDGDAEAYGIAIDQLDEAGNIETAQTLFDQTKTDQNWDLEEEVTQQLQQLIERRYA